MFKRAIIVLSIACVVVLAVAIDMVVRRHRQRAGRAAEETAEALGAAVADPAPPRPVVAAERAIDAAPRAKGPAPPPGPPPTTAAAAPGATAFDTRAFPDEASLMAGLHALGESDPALSLQLARGSFQRFPDGPDAPERNWILVKSLVNLERFDEARGEARKMVDKYPDADWSQDIRRHLLSNPP